MIVFFVYNILIFNYKDTKNYRDYQLFKRISYPELRFLNCLPNVKRNVLSEYKNLFLNLKVFFFLQYSKNMDFNLGAFWSRLSKAR